MHKQILLITLCTLVFFSAGSLIASGYDVDVHGFVSQGYLKTDNNNFQADTNDGTFEFSEIGINFATDVSDNLRVGMQFLARDLGSLGNNEIELDWAFADYRFNQMLGLRAGKIKMVKGFYNETREYDMLRTSIFLPGSIYSEIWRDMLSSIQGVSIYGSIPMDSFGNFRYQLQMGNLKVGPETNYNKAFVASLAGVEPSLEITDTTTDISYAYSGVWETPLDGLRLGASGRNIRGFLNVNKVAEDGLFADMLGKTVFDAGYSTFTGFELSAEYIVDQLTLFYEYAETKRRTDLDGNPSGKQIEQAYYAGGSYRFNDWFELGYYYSVYYPDSGSKDGDGSDTDFTAWSKEHVVSTKFDITDNWIFKLESHIVDGWGLWSFYENEELEEDWMMLAAKTTFSF
jgi:hypothetical protein